MLRLAFAGTPQFAVPSLSALAGSGHRLVGVLTQPDRPAGRGRHVAASPIKQLALELGLPLWQPARLLEVPAAASPLAGWQSDVLVVVAYGLLIPPALLAVPRLGAVNVHASLLPRWRGAAPIQHAIVSGDRETGVSIMQMDGGLDTGPVLMEARIGLDPAATAGELAGELSTLGATTLLTALEALAAGAATPAPQAEALATYAPKINRQMAQVEWGLPAEQIARQVRAFNPRPVAQTLWYGSQLRLWEARVADEAVATRLAEALPPTLTAVPGTVLGLAGEELLVLCGQRTLAIRRLQLAGRRVVSAREFAAAAEPLGARLGE